MSRDFERAVDAQRLLHRWWKWEGGQAIGRDLANFLLTKPNRQVATEWAAYQPDLLREAATFFVTGDMSAVIEAAGASMPPEPFSLRTDMPCCPGFVYFNRSIWTGNDSARAGFQAFTWNLYRGQVEVVIYADADQVQADAIARPEIVENRPARDDAWRNQFARLAPMNVIGFVEGRPLTEGALEYGPFVKALWTISQQRIALVSPVSKEADRATRRRLERAAFPLEKVRVINLRRPAQHREGPEEPCPVEWSHRWMVSGHWRNQYLPSVDAHRLQWISEYIKGPEDRPLLVRPDVFRVAR